MQWYLGSLVQVHLHIHASMHALAFSIFLPYLMIFLKCNLVRQRCCRTSKKSLNHKNIEKKNLRSSSCRQPISLVDSGYSEPSLVHVQYLPIQEPSCQNYDKPCEILWQPQPHSRSNFS